MQTCMASFTHAYMRMHPLTRTLSDRLVCLVVDDEPNNIKLVTRVLDKSNFKVLSCEDGSYVLDVLVASDWEVDVILMDQMMKQVRIISDFRCSFCGPVLNACCNACDLFEVLMAVCRDGLQAFVNDNMQSFQ